MLNAAAILPAMLVAVAAGMLLVRAGWCRRRAVSVGGWLLAAAALLVLTLAYGAWGCAVAALTGGAVAMLAVLHAGWRSPVRHRRAPRQAPSVSIPWRAGDLARRAGVFVMVVPVAFVAAQVLALAVAAFARLHGAGDADAPVLAMMVQPLAWAVLMTVQMTRASLSRMVAPPVLVAIAAAMLWGAA